MSTGTVTVMVLLSATCDSVKCGSPPPKFDQAETIAVGRQPRAGIRPAVYDDKGQSRTHHAVTFRYKGVSATAVTAHATGLPWQQFSVR